MALRKMELAKAKHYLEEVLAHRWASPCCWSPPGFLRIFCCSVLLVSAFPSRRTLEGPTMLFPCNAATRCLLCEESAAG